MTQTHPIRRRWRAALLSLMACGLAGVSPAHAQGVNDVLNKVTFEQRINEELPLDATFRDETGRVVPLGDYFGRRPVILALVYYDCPMLCTFVLNGIVKGLRPVKFNPGREFDVVVISFNPKETPALAAEKKAAYLRDYKRPGTEAGWHFLTGDAPSIRRVTEAAGFHYLFDTGTQQYAHASGIMVVTPLGKLYRYFYGIEYAPRDLQLAVVEASGDKIGTPVDRVLLYCFHYDPRTGRYGLVIMNVIRLLGTSTLLALGTFMLVMLRRERHARRANAGAESNGTAEQATKA